MPYMCGKPTCADGQDCGCIDTDEANSDLLCGGFIDAPKKAQFGKLKNPPVYFETFSTPSSCGQVFGRGLRRLGSAIPRAHAVAGEQISQDLCRSQFPFKTHAFTEWLARGHSHKDDKQGHGSHFGRPDQGGRGRWPMGVHCVGRASGATAAQSGCVPLQAAVAEQALMEDMLSQVCFFFFVLSFFP
jgi:hypothetical protein